MPGRHRETARYRYEVSLLAGKGFGGTARKAFLYSVIWLTKRCNMQVFIMRHGDAALDAASDAQRPLTLCGQDESRQIASWLSEQSVDIDQILVSPYLRARQTLEVVREVMALPAEPEVMPELTPRWGCRLHLFLSASVGERRLRSSVSDFALATGRVFGRRALPRAMPSDVCYFSHRLY